LGKEANHVIIITYLSQNIIRYDYSKTFVSEVWHSWICPFKCDLPSKYVW